MFRTKTQRKKLCSACPIAGVANLVADPFILVIIRDLLKGPKRFGDLASSLEGVSSRTLTKKLKELQTNGLIIRKETPGKPKKVEYTLTKKGSDLKSITEAMRKYGEKHL